MAMIQQPPTPELVDAASGGGGPVEREFTVEARSQWQQVRRRFVRNRRAMTGLVVYLTMVLVAFIVPLFYPYDLSFQDRTFDAFEAAPGYRGHILGLGDIGRDVGALLMSGVQASTGIAVICVVVAGTLGILVGSLAGYYGGRVDFWLMRTVDLLLTLPALVILIVFSSNFPGARSFVYIGLFIAIFGWFDLARLVRASFMSLREREFVEAAHAMGASNRRIIFKHLIPNVLGTIIVWTTLMAAVSVLAEASLAYLGYGVQDGYSLGRLVSDGVAAADSRWWLFYIPGLTLVIIVLCINLIGDGVRDAFDPTNARVRA